MNHRTRVESGSRRQNRGRTTAPGQAWGEPAYRPDGVRRRGGASLVWAPVWNVRTWRRIRRRVEALHERETPKWQIRKGQSTEAGTGADRPVVAMKPGNAGGAKGKWVRVGAHFRATRTRWAVNRKLRGRSR